MWFTMQGAGQQELLEEDKMIEDFVIQKARNKESQEKESRRHKKESQRKIKDSQVLEIKIDEIYRQEVKNKKFFSEEDKRQETGKEDFCEKDERTVYQKVRSGEVLEKEDRGQIKHSQHSINHNVKNLSVIHHLFLGK